MVGVGDVGYLGDVGAVDVVVRLARVAGGGRGRGAAPAGRRDRRAAAQRLPTRPRGPLRARAQGNLTIRSHIIINRRRYFPHFHAPEPVACFKVDFVSTLIVFRYFCY